MVTHVDGDVVLVLVVGGGAAVRVAVGAVIVVIDIVMFLTQAAHFVVCGAYVLWTPNNTPTCGCWIMHAHACAIFYKCMQRGGNMEEMYA